MTSAAAALLAASGRYRILPGLSDAELDALESRFLIRFSADHRAFLAAGLPTGDSWPDWRNGDEMALRMHLGLPARSIRRAIVEDGLWPRAWGSRPHDAAMVEHQATRLIAAAPRMIPVYGHAFMVAQAGSAGTPVWSIDGAEVRQLGDLRAFVELLCAQRAAPELPPEIPPEIPWASAQGVEFWRDLLPNAPDPQTPAPLNVPPFPPDPALADSPAVAPPREPVEALAALGVHLSGVTRHDDVLLLGLPMWTADVTPGADAAAVWHAVRGLFGQTGLWPVLLTERTWSRIGDSGDPWPSAQLLSADLDGARVLANRYAAHVADDPIPRGGCGDVDGIEQTEWITDWSNLYDVDRFRRLALVPTPAHWYVPGLLRWSGAANYDVGGTEHAAILRRWSGRWGSELLALDDETIALRVAAPPTDSPTALQCALEVYLYCPDTLDPDPDGIDVLAPSLTGHLWPLWWD